MHSQIITAKKCGRTFPGSVLFPEFRIIEIFIHSPFQNGQKILNTPAPDNPVAYRTIGIQHEHRGVYTHPITPGNINAFPLFHIHLDIDKMGITKLSYRLVRENPAFHHLARAAPSGIAIHENIFPFFLRFLQCLFQRQVFDNHTFEIQYLIYQTAVMPSGILVSSFHAFFQISGNHFTVCLSHFR